MNTPNNLARDVPVINMRELPDREWTRQAACRGHDPDLFFAEHATGSYTEARIICGSCLVRQECLDWAVATGTKFGLWGGLAPPSTRTSSTTETSMSYLTPAILRDLNDVEFDALVAELEERGDQFDAKVRMLVNDELRRRGRATLHSSKRYGRW